MSELAARHLIQHGATSLLICQPHRVPSPRIAADLRAVRRTPIATTESSPSISSTPQAHRADIVITSTGAGPQARPNLHPSPRPHLSSAPPRPPHVLHRHRRSPRRRPRASTTSKAASSTTSTTSSRSPRATSPIAPARPPPLKASSPHEVEQYQQRLGAQPSVEAIKALQQSAEVIRQAELARSSANLAGLSEQQRAAVDTLTRSLVGKLLHPQIAALRNRGSGNNGGSS